MDTNHSDELVFYVNGKKLKTYTRSNGNTENETLTNPVLLPGTKEGCGHGGCGSCTVMVSRKDPGEKQIRHYTVNACLFPLCEVHGLAITTVEGVGNPRTGLHEVQKRLIESHGLQCGFCTPGFVMSVFTLLRNNPKPTRNELEKAIEGNLCRCTGYRPIVQAFNTMCQDACPQGEFCCKNVKILTAEQNQTNQTADQSHIAVTDTSQVAIFPSELQLSDKYCSSLATFKGTKYTWIRPTCFEELLILKDKHPDAPVIMGNTIAGMHLKMGKLQGNVLIYGGGIASLKSVVILQNGIQFGAGLTISSLYEKLKEVEPNVAENKRRHFQALYCMIEKYGAVQIRNTATIGGSLMSGRSNSDIITILTGLDASVSIHSASSERTEKVTCTTLALDGKEVIKSLFLPFSNEKEYSMFHKQSDRRTFSLALVNSCMLVRFSEEGLIKCLRMAFGGIGKEVYVIQKTPTPDGNSRWLQKRQWDYEVLENVLESLPDLLTNDDGPPVDKYKLAVAAGFFYKFYNYVNQTKSVSNPLFSSAPAIYPDSLPLNPSCGEQFYGDFSNPDQKKSESLHRPVTNVSSEAIVSGEAVFIDDMPSVTGELFLALVTSKRAHAKIINIEPSAALAVQGVHGFIDHKDIPGQNMWGALFPEEELLAANKVVFYGQPIGAIVAESREIARQAVRLVKVEYEDLKAILTIEEAIKNNSFFVLHSEITTGNTERGFQESDVVIEGEIGSGYQEHFYMEPWSCLVVPRVENDEIEIFVASQDLMAMQEGVSKFLDVGNHKISCSVKRLGGSFGGKETRIMMICGPAAIAAHKFKRPVRCILSREEDMEMTGKRHPYLTKYKVGVSKGGKIKALDLKVYLNGGNSVDFAGLILSKSMSDFNGGYRIENLNFKGFVCKTNVPSNTAFRAFGAIEGRHFMEDIIFNIGCTLDLPQETVAEANFFSKGDMTKFGIPLVNCTVRELWDRCREQSKFTERKADIAEFNRLNRWRKRGIVMTVGRYSIGYDLKCLYQGTAVISIYTDGTVLLTHGGIEMGQGINTKMIQIASKELGIPSELIYTSDSNTKSTPNSVFTAGSLGTDIYGPAVMDACRIMNENLQPLRQANPEKSWKELIKMAYFNRVKLTATGFSRYAKEEYDPIKKTGTKVDYYTYGAICTEVEVDVLTGENQVLQSDIVMDVGKCLNPGIDIGQIEGAFVQGLGMMTSEYIDVDSKGKMINCSPLSYKIPNVRCIPRKFNVTLVREDSVVTPVYSAKAIGEPPMLLSVSVIMAIREAIKAARAEIGVYGYFRLDSPATVERIRMACGDQLKSFKKQK